MPTSMRLEDVESEALAIGNATMTAVNPSPMRGVTIHGTVEAGPHSINSTIYLTEDQLTVKVLSKIFCMDPSTIVLRPQNDANKVVHPQTDGIMPIEQLVIDPKLEWVCTGEPDRKNFGFNGYTTVKTVAVGLLNSSLFAVHLAICITLGSNLYSLQVNCPANSPVPTFGIATLSVSVTCMLLQLVIFYLCFVIGMHNIDEAQGQNSLISVALRCCTPLRTTLARWNKIITLLCCIVFLGNIIFLVCYIKVDSCETNTQ
ncbi:uncharacterized protein LOC100379051 isoform X2 [Saccoglossus kowalevskii]